MPLHAHRLARGVPADSVCRAIRRSRRKRICRHGVLSGHTELHWHEHEYRVWPLHGRPRSVHSAWGNLYGACVCVCERARVRAFVYACICVCMCLCMRCGGGDGGSEGGGEGGGEGGREAEEEEEEQKEEVGDTRMQKTDAGDWRLDDRTRQQRRNLVASDAENAPGGPVCPHFAVSKTVLMMSGFMGRVPHSTPPLWAWTPFSTRSHAQLSNTSPKVCRFKEVVRDDGCDAECASSCQTTSLRPAATENDNNLARARSTMPAAQSGRGQRLLG